jgi:hypothetical protein
MNKCEELEGLLRKSVSGELTAAETEILQKHARECPECRGCLQVHEDLRASGKDGINIPVQELERTRLAVLRSVNLRRKPLVFGLRSLFSKPLFAWGTAAAMLACGVLLGYFLSVRRENPGVLSVRQTDRNAIENAGFSDIENSPFVYSNVAFKRLGGEELALSFDVTRHVDIKAETRDPMVRDLLVQALLNPSPLGARLKAISFAETVKDSEVKRALIISMLNDASVAVRLKAQSILMSYKDDQEVRSAFLNVLLKDESTQMRLQSLDYLVDNNVSRDALGKAVRELRSQGQTAVLYKMRNSRFEIRD